MSILPQPKLERSFSGTEFEDPRQWLDDFEKFATAAGWTDASRMQFVQFYLLGAASKWLELVTLDSKFEKWEDWRTAFLKAFGSTDEKDHLESRLFQRTLLQNETVREYYFDVLKLCHLYNPKMSEMDKIRAIKRGLPPSWNLRISGGDCTSLDSLFSALTKFQVYHLQRQDPNTAISADLQAAIASFSETVQAFTTQVNDYRNNDFSRGRGRGRQNSFRRPFCNYCKKVGHWISQCRAKPQSRRTGYCYVCGDPSHFAVTCPQRATSPNLQQSQTSSGNL